MDCITAPSCRACPTTACNVDAAAPSALAGALRGNGVDATLMLIDNAAASGSSWSSTAILKAVDDFLDLEVKPPTSRRRAATRP